MKDPLTELLAALDRKDTLPWMLAHCPHGDRDLALKEAWERCDDGRSMVKSLHRVWQVTRRLPDVAGLKFDSGDRPVRDAYGRVMGFAKGAWSMSLFHRGCVVDTGMLTAWSSAGFAMLSERGWPGCGEGHFSHRAMASGGALTIRDAIPAPTWAQLTGSL